MAGLILDQRELTECRSEAVDLVQDTPDLACNGQDPIDAAFAASEAGQAGVAQDLLRRSTPEGSLTPWPAIYRGWRAMQAEDWAAASGWWALVREIFPDDPTAFLDGSLTLEKGDRLHEANSLLAEGIKRFPDNCHLCIQYVWSAKRLGLLKEVVQRCEAARTGFAREAIFYVEAAIALRDLGRLEEADLLLKEAAIAFPENAGVLYQYAMNADRLRNRLQSVARWKMVRESFPDDDVARRALQRAEYEARADLSEDAEAETASPSSAESSAAALLMGFEGLGENCEFGFVQREAGSEPLSLLRWAYVTPEVLIAGLNADFEGVGDPHYTRVEPNEGGELMASDTRYFKSMHTHVHMDAVDREKFLADMCKRLHFLRRKLLRDLTDARKIFVCKYQEEIGRETLEAIRTALQRRGPARVLCVLPPTATHPAGSIERLSQGLTVGRVKVVERPLHEPLDHATWLEVCRQTADAA